ncbi:MAG: hypothetical protein EAX96_12430 [Candidatus Lokiarchaeota archaeon]|nr:hypothetical protein [Candidatus Lokiarchaeota archaeon]
MIKNICVFGSYVTLKHDLIDIVQIGETLAVNGYTIISGGFGGSMEQVSKGAKQGGGKTIGVTYYEFPDLIYHKANEFVDEEIITNSIFERIEKMMDLADAFLVFPGGTGTLFELASVIESVNKGLIEIKPIICFKNYWKLISESLKAIKITNKEFINRNGTKSVNELIYFVQSINELLKFLQNYK